jgi:hypothetical protein
MFTPRFGAVLSIGSIQQTLVEQTNKQTLNKQTGRNSLASADE